MIFLLGLFTALAAPKHPFAVFEPPSSYSDLSAKKKPTRIWWESQPNGVDIQYLHNGQWKDLARSVPSGYTSKALPTNTQFRVKSDDETQWSEPFAPVPWVNPTEIAGLNSSFALFSRTIADLSLDKNNILWGATLGGGLLRLDTKSQDYKFLGPYDGIPNSKVISVDTEGDRVLIGTSEGAVLLENSIPTRYWKSELPNVYTQSVRIVNDSFWIGTYEGLFIETPSESYKPLSPFSIFSIEPLSEEETIVGYQGLRLIDSSYQAQPLLDSQKFHAYDILHTGAETYFATEEKGVQRLTGTNWSLVQNIDATQLSWGLHGLWMAAGKKGLIHSSGKTYQKQDGLAGSTVWSVATQGQQVWVGTNGGLTKLSLTENADVSAAWHLPISSTPIERRAETMLIHKKGVFWAGQSGVWHLGKPHRHANNLDVAAAQPTVALLEHSDQIWAFGNQTAVWMTKRGRLDRINLPIKPLSVVTWQNQFWLASKSGIWRMSPTETQPRPAYPDANISQLEVYDGRLWGIDENGVLISITPTQLKPFIQTGYALQIASSGDALCVGTENGLERYWHRRETKVEDVLGDGDLGIAVTAVAGDGTGGCWFGGEEGTIGWVGVSGAATKISLPGLKTPRPLQIVPIDAQHAWVLTSKGTWRVRLPQ